MGVKHLILISILLMYFSTVYSATLTPSVYKKLEKAQAAIQNGKSDVALDILFSVEKKAKERSMDKAMSWQLIGHVYVSRENYKEAINAYEKSLAQQSLEERIQFNIMRNLGQLYISQEYYEKGKEALLTWLANSKGKIGRAEAHILIANAYAELKNTSEAISHVKRAIALNKLTPENWYQMLLGLYYQTEQYVECINLLKKMLIIFPQQKRYWQQLAGIYINLGKEQDALMILQLAWKKGLLDGKKDILELSNLYASQGLPFEAANVLKSGLNENLIENDFENWQRVANFYLQAKESHRSVNALEQRIKLAKSSDDYISAVKITMSAERWQLALKIIERAKKEKLDKADDLSFLNGIILFELNELQQAKYQFSKLVSSKKYKNEVSQWLEYLE